MTSNVQVLETYLKAIDAHDVDGIRAVFATVAVVQAPGASLAGLNAVTDWIAVFWRAFPDLRHEILSSVESDDMAAAEVRFAGTHTGPLASPEGDIPATGKSFAFSYAHVTRFADGVIVEDHVYLDQMDFLTQLDLLG